jgi:cell division septation protein DedD
MYLAAGGALVVLVFSFGLGFVVAERQLSEDARRGLAMARSATAVSSSNEWEATVRISSPGADSGGENETTRIEPSFYKVLLEKNNPYGEKMGPLELLNAPAPAKSARSARAPASAPRTSAQAKNGSTPKTKPGLMPPGGRAPAKAISLKTKSSNRGMLFTIQVLSVQKPERAIRVLRKLRDKGFSAFIQRVEIKERGAWLRIRVGRFPDRESALRTLQSIRAKTSVQGGQIVPL